MFTFLYNLIYKDTSKQENLIKNFILTKYRTNQYLNIKKAVNIIQNWVRTYCINAETNYMIYSRVYLKKKSKLYLNST